MPERNASPEEGRAAMAAHDDRMRADRAEWVARDAELNNDLRVAGRSRGLGPDGLGPADTATISGTLFRRTTNPRESVDAETYTSADGRVTLHQDRQYGTWIARETGKGSWGRTRHADPVDAFAEVLEGRAREDACARRAGLAEQAASLPKAAAELYLLAEERGWKTGVERGEDSGGSPFVTLHVGRRDGDQTWYYKITWHTRGTGTYRLFGKICKTPANPGWHDAPSLTTIKSTVQDHPTEERDA